MQSFEALQVAQFLNQQRLKILRRELRKQVIQTARQRSLRKAGRLRPLLEHELANWIMRLKPVLTKFANSLDDALRRARGKVAFAISFQRLAGVANHLRS